jgi:hypothetical protein
MLIARLVQRTRCEKSWSVGAGYARFSSESAEDCVCEGFIEVELLFGGVQRCSIPLQTRRQQNTSIMSDNIIVKTVAGTCITFSFILAG